MAIPKQVTETFNMILYHLLDWEINYRNHLNPTMRARIVDLIINMNDLANDLSDETTPLPTEEKND